MSSKEKILAALRQNSVSDGFPVGGHPMPDLSALKPITFDDPVAEFKQKATTVAGAKLIEAKADDDLNTLIRQAYPEASVIATNIEGIHADLNPDTVATAQELERVDVGIVKGDIGVAENACIWIPQTMKEKAICFASQYLVIILSKDAIVNNMHEAYARIEASKDYFAQYKFGTFISGPSKTADIESALVYGAQAARGVTILLI